MQHTILPGDPDIKLRSFLDAETEQNAVICLEKLLDTQIRPIVTGILNRKLQRPLPQSGYFRGLQFSEEADAEELCQDVLVQITVALVRMRNRVSAPISDLSDYTAATTLQVLNHYFRKHAPNRASLTNKLRYLLNNRPKLCRWKDVDGEWLAGYRHWRESGCNGGFCNHPNYAESFQWDTCISDKEIDTPEKLIVELFDWFDHPIRFDDLVGIVADIWHVRDLKPRPLPTDNEEAAPPMVQMQFTEGIHNQMCLQRYWRSICLLPLNQRRCLLLQASDSTGNSLIHIVHACGIASLQEIATTIIMPMETLKAIYQELPWEDKTIAAKLGTTAQYVIQLRRMARKRLGQMMQSEEICTT